MDDRYDSALMGILQHEGKLDRFLDVMFSFLCRRTDFYHILTQESQNLGFPPGYAQKMVMNAMKKFEAVHQQTYGAVTGPSRPVAAASRPSPPQRPPADVPPVAQSVEVTSEKPASPVKDPRPAPVADAKPETSESSDAAYQAPSESYNGADREAFSWSQTIGDVDLRVAVPQHIRTAKDVKVKLTRKSVSIQVRKEVGDDFRTLMEDEFPWEVNTEESMWSLLPKDRQIHINVEKMKERWWDKALKTEAGIDIRKIDCSRPMSDLDDESQAKIQQLMYDQRQKELGLPTSEEQKMTGMLAKAWNAEGSPFQGQAFDPSRVKMGADGSVTID